MQALSKAAAAERIDTYSVLGLNERIVDGHDVDCVELNTVIYCQRCSEGLVMDQGGRTHCGRPGKQS
jgi:hypothetical protein